MIDMTERLLRTALTRRPVVLAAAALLVAPSLVLAQDKKADPVGDVAAELMKPGPLPDLVLGKADAPVTIVEYASMTCSHCANFHTAVLPKLKEKYIDTGKVRLILREFPLDNLAAAASMLARCAAGDKSYELIGAFFASSALAGLAGFLVAPITSASIFMGLAIGLKGFSGAMIGGLTNPRGCVLGGFVLGLLESYVNLWQSQWREVAIFGLVILVLAVKPTGLFGKRLAEKV